MTSRDVEIPYSFQLLVCFISIVLTFVFIASYFPSERQMVYSRIQKNIQAVPTEIFISLLSSELPFISKGPEEKKESTLISIGLELATAVNLGDARSLLGNELPGFSIYKEEILISGTGTDYTTLPRESAAPSLEDILKEREIPEGQAGEEEKEAPKTENEITEEQKPDAPQEGEIKEKRFYVYQTHSWESYLPLLGLEGDPDVNKAVDSKTNIILVGDMLTKELEKNGLGAIHDKTDMGQTLKEKGWKTPRSYKASREIVQDAVANNNELSYFIDLHRDSLRKEHTTVTINDKSYAKVVFVVGKNNQHFEKNLKVVNDLHEILQKKYPELSRGVIGKSGKGVDGVYNQDLSQRSILIEIGGIDNNMNELKNTAEALAKVISEYYWKAEKVNGEGR
ncbi:stage II sporulation protein P [Domibacillus robiginosus]|uniref:stage II sporulation protein P n=1 Tax=Domibacillus robiginosus TaxID=1071054 RepID=UPI00067BB180|nr:stage II sporulation protein P [Domibacillus robiginosus]